MTSGSLREDRKEALWRRLVRQQADSGLCVRAWCGRHKVKVSQFYWWRTELARRDAQKSKAAFVAVRVCEDALVGQEGSIEIVLGNGWRIRVAGRVDRQMLVDVLAVLEDLAC